MSEKIDNPPAFPVTLFEGQTLGDGTANGMSLRDYFAAKALQGFLSFSTADGDGYVPVLKDLDMQPLPLDEDIVDGKHYYYRSNRGYWVSFNKTPKESGSYGITPHRVATTFEQRLARDAYDIADAMFAARQTTD